MCLDILNSSLMYLFTWYLYLNVPYVPQTQYVQNVANSLFFIPVKYLFLSLFYLVAQT